MLGRSGSGIAWMTDPRLRRAYDIGGMTADEFDDFGAVRRTLHQFIGGYVELVSLVRDFMMPDPDVR